MERGLSQGEVERRTGLLRCYICRIETGHNVPTIETLERFAAALDVPLHSFFDDDEGSFAKATVEGTTQNGASADARYLRNLRAFWVQLGDFDRRLLLTLARQLAVRKGQ
jgi:transcriptional regulator with XRE-family HTH domain